jgi:hypothetical protein
LDIVEVAGAVAEVDVVVDVDKQTHSAVPWSWWSFVLAYLDLE